MGISALNNLRFFIFEFLLITHCYFVLCSDRQLWLLWFWFWFCNTHGKDDNTDKSQVWRIWGPNQRSTFLRVILLIPDCTSFTFLCFVIGPENSRCSLNQSNEKIKTIATLSFAFSRALSGLLVYTLSSHWLYRVLSPGENLSRIFKDLTRSSWGPLRILLRIFMRIFKILVKIFKDPSFSCQDLQGSFIFLPRSSRIFHFLAKIFKDLSFSCQDLWGSLTFLLASHCCGLG